MDWNYPEVFYWGNICDMLGCELEGGNPKRCYVGDWEQISPDSSVKIWKDHYANKKPGDFITVKIGDEIEELEVVKAPASWSAICWEEEEKRERDSFDRSMSICDVFILDLGDCIFDKLEIEDEKYPCMKWCIVKSHKNDSDLLYIVPFMECDPYGRITDPDYLELREYLTGLEDEEDEKPFGIFVEDEESQDHVFVFTGRGTWIHRTDLIGVDRDCTRNQIVEPSQKHLSELVGL